MTVTLPGVSSLFLDIFRSMAAPAGSPPFVQQSLQGGEINRATGREGEIWNESFCFYLASAVWDWSSAVFRGINWEF